MAWTPKVLLLDLDGTIINSSQPQLEALALFLKEEGRYPGSREALLRFIGVPSDQLVAELFPDREPGPLLARLARHERQQYGQLVVYEEMWSVLAAIKNAGLPVAIVTSQSNEELADTKTRIDLEDWVSLWVTADDVAAPKPDPAAPRLALERLGFEPGQAIMIGDTVYDMKAGARAGTMTGAALWGSVNPEALLALNPDYAFKNPSEITNQLLPGP